MIAPGGVPSRGGRFPVELAEDAGLTELFGRTPTLASLTRGLALPERLSHYTSAATLVAILQGGPFGCTGRGEADPRPGVRLPFMRATHPRFMNDRSELKLATALMVEELARREATLAPDAADRVAAVRACLARLADEPWIWAVSWSERANQLSQWRAYAGGVGGCSLGIPVAHLQRMAAWQGFVLVPCVYREDLQRRIAGEVVERSVRLLRDPPEGADDDRPGRLAQDLLFLGALMKHAGFEEEREWRLIRREPADTSGDRYRPERRFHASPYGLASWVPFWLRDGAADVLRGACIVAGPAEDPAPTVATLRALLDTLPGLEAEVRASGIPLRR